jgi:undecaprenyl-diphosphatase
LAFRPSAVYLAGSAIGQAAPTPGGLGAVEAALIAGLVSVGLDKEIAVRPSCCSAS